MRRFRRQPGIGHGELGALLISVGMQTYALDPVTGQLGPKIANGQDGITSPNGSKVAYVRDYDACQPQPEGGCSARDLLTANLDGTGERPVAIGRSGEGPPLP